MGKELNDKRVKKRLVNWLEGRGFGNNFHWFNLIWSVEDEIHEIIVESCIGDYYIGYYINRELKDGKYRVYSYEELRKTVKELEILYLPNEKTIT